MPRTPPPDIQAILDAMARDASPDATLDELNALLARGMQGYNRQPQAELGGLSPDEMYQLMYGDWTTAGALRVSRDLTLDDVRDSALFADARTLMSYVNEHGPIKPTARKNLPRSVVKALLPELQTALRNTTRDDFEFPGHANEDDVLWLPVIRYTLELAKLVTERKGFTLSRRGRDLLADSAAGELYALFFETLMRTVDLRALDGSDDQADLQATLPYTFWRLKHCTEWSSPAALAESAWLKSAKDPPNERDEAIGFDSAAWAFRRRALEPLMQFGLLEQRLLPADVEWQRESEFRITPLFNRFFRFAFERGGAGGVGIVR